MSVNYSANNYFLIGVVRYPSGASYEGNIVDNMMHGHGKYIFPDTAIYEGSFVHNRYPYNLVF